MSQELRLLRLFVDDRSAHFANHGYLDEIGNLEREMSLLFNLVTTYYEENQSEDNITREDCLAFYDLRYPKARSRELHIDLIGQVYSTHINKELMQEQLDQLIEKHNAAEIVNKLMPVLEGEKYGILDSVRDDVDRYVDLLHNPPERLSVPVPCTLTITELVKQEILDGGWPWHIPELTDIIGGLRRKTLGLIYAYVDAGKTSFSMAACAHFAKQFQGTDNYIAYCGNEESAPRLRLRLAQSILNWTRGQVRDDQKGAEAAAASHGFDNVLLFDEILTGGQLEYIVKEYNPAIVFVDQSTDVEVQLGRKREGVDYLKALFKYYRSLGTKNDCAIVGVAQGTGDAENTKYLRLSDIFGSRVAIQGALDWAVGIGKLVDDPIDEHQRYLNIPKNKLHDGDGGKFAVMFNRYINRWRPI